MRLMDSAECAQWCSERGIDSTTARHLRFSGLAEPPSDIALPQKALEVVGLTNVLSTYLSGGQHPRSLLWLVERGMWSEEFESVGARLWDRLAQGYGRGTASGVPTPGLVFEANETEDERAFLLTVILFQWDAALVPEHGRYIVQVSHDGYVRLLALDGPTAGELASVAANWSKAS